MPQPTPHPKRSSKVRLFTLLLLSLQIGCGAHDQAPLGATSGTSEEHAAIRESEARLQAAPEAARTADPVAALPMDQLAHSDATSRPEGKAPAPPPAPEVAKDEAAAKPSTAAPAKVKQAEAQRGQVGIDDLLMSPMAQGYGVGGGGRAGTGHGALKRSGGPMAMGSRVTSGGALAMQPAEPEFNTEAYAHQQDNDFQQVADKPLSTFSIDVDTASYANVRRFLSNGQRPPADAVRIEELINYFDYEYPAPSGDAPFSVYSEVATAPWNPQHRLLHIGLQGRVIDQAKVPARNLVFLIDVSGSMDSPDKLPLLVNGLSMLTENLRSQDRIAMVVYAGASGLVLPPTSGKDKGRILEALQQLSAGGSTNGADGIQLAYRVARDTFVQGGINRVILATDGDFNVGVTNEGELTRLIEKERESGVFLTVLGFGTGNVKDSTMELLADKGNGNYAYIDSQDEAHKVLVREAGATLVTIAKDVKLQVEFNPALVASYRLIGYENRVLADRDFNDDKKDAGEIGAGHSVTALYEVVLRETAVQGAPEVDALRYQHDRALTDAAKSGEVATLKLRYKAPDGATSRLETVAIRDTGHALEQAGTDFRFAAAVAGFGMVLRGSEARGAAKLETLRVLAQGAMGTDPHGDRAQLLQLMHTAARLGVDG